jgi:hypothetical protein
MQEPSSAKDSFLCVYRAADYHQLMTIKMLLERKNVNYYVDGEESPVVATMRVMVDADHADEIKTAIRDELGLK